MTITRPIPAQSPPARRAPSLVELRVIPSRVPNGCRTKVDGVRCGHLEHAHRDVGFEGWRVRCVCGCTTYRDSWPRALLTVAVGVLVGLFGAGGIWVLLIALYELWIGGGW